MAQVARQALESLQPVGEGPHADGERLVVEPPGEVGGAVVEPIELGQPLQQELLALGGPALRLEPGGLGGLGPSPIGPGAFEDRRQFGLEALEPEEHLGEGLDPRRFDDRFPGKGQQLIEILRRHPEDAVGGARLGGGSGNVPAFRLLLRLRPRRLRNGGTVAAQGKGDLRDEGVDLGELSGPFPDLALGRLGHPREQIDPAEDEIDPHPVERDAAFPHGGEAILDGVGRLDPGGEADDPARPLERMRRPHAALEDGGRRRVALQLEQSGNQHLGLPLGLRAEDGEHGEIDREIGGALGVIVHARLRFKAPKSNGPSRQPTEWPFQGRTERM